MFVEQIAEKFIVKCAIGFGFERLFHLAEQRNIGKSGLSKDGFARLNIRLCKRLAFQRDYGVALFNAQQTEENRGVHSWKKRVNFKTQFIREMVQIRTAALVGENLQ